jgi:hypothetical protein
MLEADPDHRSFGGRGLVSETGVAKMRLTILAGLTVAAAVSLAAEPSLAQNVRDSLLPNTGDQGKSGVLPSPQQPNAVAGSLTIQQIPKSDPQASNLSASAPPPLEANGAKQ